MGLSDCSPLDYIYLLLATLGLALTWCWWATVRGPQRGGVRTAGRAGRKSRYLAGDASVVPGVATQVLAELWVRVSFSSFYSLYILQSVLNYKKEKLE